MRIIYNDPYAEILRIIQTFTHQTDRYEDPHGPLVAVIRNSVRELFDLRSRRLNNEALALAPTHFDVMTFLSGLLLVGTALGTVATAQTDGVPTEVSRILFSALVVCYTTIYEMAYDLNRPFDGIYQLRRSGAAMHFLQIKQMVATHPLLKDSVTFDPMQQKQGDRDDNQDDENDELVPKVDWRKKRKIWCNI